MGAAAISTAAVVFAAQQIPIVNETTGVAFGLTIGTACVSFGFGVACATLLGRVKRLEREHRAIRKWIRQQDEVDPEIFDT